MITRTTDTIVGEADLITRLESGRPLRIKYGVDCTAPDLHLGHAVNLWMMRSLQDLGHKVVFLLGDLTTRIGDPTGRSETRPVLSPEEIDANAASFLAQVSLVLRTDPEVFEVRRNSEWFGPMDVATLLGLFGQVTHAQLIARDMFRTRIAEGREIALHELTYPVLQGYDSFAMNSDLTIVGSDQLFNEQLGRHFQQRLGAAPQAVIVTTITPGIDGGPKQSKSLRNYIGLTDSPRDKFGKLMSLPDSLVETYARVYTELPLETVAVLGSFASQGGPAARDAKLRLAAAVVTRYHGAGAAKAELEAFHRVFSERAEPEEMPSVVVGASVLTQVGPTHLASDQATLITDRGGQLVETKTVEALVSVGDRYLGQAPLFAVESPWWSEVSSVTRRLDELLGTPTMVLRLLETHDGYHMRGGRVLYHVQVESEPRPGVLDPRPRPDWPDLVKPHPLRSTWAEVDGPRRLISWATGFIGEDTPAQVKTWNLSCLIQFAGAGAWAKATSRFCSVDADIIQHVHRYDAALAPGVLAVDLENRWSLLRHAPGIDCWKPDQATVQDVVSRWVAVQAALAAEADELNTPRMLPRDLPDELDSLLAGEAGKQLSAEELAGAQRLREDLPAIVDALESSGLPTTLVHGDFHPGNWRSDGTNRLIVDWADSYVGHPATDIERLRDWLPAEKQDNAVSTWTAAWQTHLPGSEPSRALKPSTVIAQLLGAVTYQRFLDNIEPSERIYHEGDPADGIREAVLAAAAL